MKHIKCFESDLGPEVVSAIAETINSGEISFGKKVREFESKISKMNRADSLGYSSGSAAAYAIFTRLYELHGSCLVVTPSLTFTSPVWAAKTAGHEIMWVDVDKNCLWSCEDYQILRHRLKTDKQIVVMPMLYGGITGRDHDFGFLGDEIVVVDSAHCLTPALKYDYAFLSFHSQKPLAMAQGGAILVDSTLSDQLPWFERFRNFGRYPAGHTYRIIQDGFKFYMDNLNASIGLAQLPDVWDRVKKRKENFTYLMNSFDHKRIGHMVPHDEFSSYYLATLVLKKEFNNAEIIQLLASHNIQATFHYPSLHNMTFHNLGANLPWTDEMETRLVNLPIHQNLDNEDLAKIAKVLNRIQR